MSHPDQSSPEQRRPEEILFAAALERPHAERAAFLEHACQGNAPLRRRLEALLTAHDLPDALPEPPTETARPSSLAQPVEVDKLLGQRIGRYKLLERIGEGGCGVVYVAEQTEPVRRRVALKLIKPGMDSKAVIARFEVERQALALMDHPNIAMVLDGGTTESGLPFFVMELVRGAKITEHCDHQKLSTEERIKLFLPVCQAVQHAHQKGIIHRDIKPSNVVVTVHDGVAVPKVIDFGIAKAIGVERLTDQTIYTALDQFVGTPAYMSPEQAERTEQAIDARTDVYSLGVLLYELITGRTPFDARALLDSGFERMLRTIREEEPPRPSRRLSTLNAAALTSVAQARRSEPPRLLNLVRGDLDWIAMKCLEKNRARRYDTASDLVSDLRRHLEHEPILARPPSAAYRSGKFIRRHRAVIAVAGAVSLGLMVGAVVSNWSARRIKLRDTVQPGRREANAPAPLKWLVTNTDDNGPGSLREAVLDAANNTIITFATNLSGAIITLTGGELVLDRKLTIDASMLPGSLQINGRRAGRIFNLADNAILILNSLTITNGHVSRGTGGGILVGGALVMTGCTIAGNSADYGGGIDAFAGRVALTNCTIAGNTAKEEGGGLRTTVASLTHCTVSANRSGGYGGGVRSCTPHCTINFSIVAGNFFTNLDADFFGYLNEGASTNNITSGNPQLAPLGNYGGPTPTMPPLPGSRAIDAAIGSDFATDQRGFPRPVGKAADLGAVEGVFNSDTKDQARPSRVPRPASAAMREVPPAGLTKLVLNNADHGAGSLREVVADARSGDTITFAPSLSGQTVLLTSGHIVLNKDLTIDASALPRAIHINANRNGRSFLVTHHASVVLDSLVITNGLLAGFDGAGVFNQGKLTVQNCAFVGNETDWSGGGIFNQNGTVEAANSTFHGNTVTGSGGAIASFEAKARLVLIHCTISGNKSLWKNDRQGGGGIYNYAGGMVCLTNSIIAGNSSGSGLGPDVWSQASGVSAERCLIGDAANSGIISRRGGNLIGRSALLAPLGDYGGPTPTMPPLPGSPALDAALGSVFTTDQRGFARPVGAAPDLGAVEGSVTPGTEPVAALSSAVPASTNVSTVRAAAQWMIKNHLEFRIATDGTDLKVTREQEIPARDFQVVALWFDRWASALPQPRTEEFQILRSVTTLRSVFVQRLLGLADEDFAFLAQNPSLDWLEIDGSERLSNGILKHISGLKRLEHLKLAHAPRLTGRGFADASWLTSLKSAEFYFTSLDDDALRALATCPKLEYLVVSDTRITDAGVLALSEARRLKVLSVEHSTSLTAQGLAGALPRLVGLQELNLAEINCGDETAAAVATLTNLTKLNLKGSKLTDAGLAKLSTMRSLRSLEIFSTRVSPEGITAFEQARPQCVLKR